MSNARFEELKNKARGYRGKSFQWAMSDMWASRNHYASISDIHDALMSVRGLVSVG